MTDGGEDVPSVEELREVFGHDPDDPPCSIHETDDGRPYWFAGNSYAAKERVKEKLESAGYTWEHPEDGRFHSGEKETHFVVTGRVDDSEDEDTERVRVSGEMGDGDE